MFVVIASAAALSPAAPIAPESLWEIARRNARTLRISTLVCADQVARLLKDDAGVQRAVAWCKDHGITRVYVESYRDGFEPSEADLRRARDGFRKAGLLVSGCVTPTRIGKQSTGWSGISCYTDPDVRREVARIFRRAASLFDEIMIDDFLFTDCRCAECERARGARTWADYRCDLMLEVSRRDILGAARAANPKARLILKYPCWHEDFQERGYDVERQTALYDRTWVGTETRGGVPGSGWTAEPAFRAYWLMRWLLGIGGAKCGGGWYDWIGTSPPYYLEQARLTVLGGAREAMLFNFGALMEDALGQRDAAAWRGELPLHFELARQIAGRKPRGLLGWKPPNSPPGADRNLHALLGMAGFPVVAAHRFDPAAPGWVFGDQARADAGWRAALASAMASGRPAVVSPTFAAAGGAERAIVLPANRDANRHRALAEMPRAQLDALRDRATTALGVRFHAPYGVGLFLFGADTAVVSNFTDEPAACALRLARWPGARVTLCLPAGAAVAGPAGEEGAFTLPARAMVVLRKAAR